MSGSGGEAASASAPAAATPDAPTTTTTTTGDAAASPEDIAAEAAREVAEEVTRARAERVEAAEAAKKAMAATKEAAPAVAKEEEAENAAAPPPPLEGEVAEPLDGPRNGRSVGARLGLVNVSRALGERLGPLRSVLEEALREDAVARHDAALYEELGRILREEDPMAAVDLYCSFPFRGDNDFEENALRLAAINVLLAQRQLEDPRLAPLLISLGKGFGVRQIEKEVDVLSRAGHTEVCKAIYMAVTGLSEENSRGFFQSKGWADSYTSAQVAAGRGQRRLQL